MTQRVGGDRSYAEMCTVLATRGTKAFVRRGAVRVSTALEHNSMRARDAPTTQNARDSPQCGGDGQSLYAEYNNCQRG